MGFKDRLQKIKESVSLSPLDVTLIQLGTPETLLAGAPVVVNAKVKGEADETIERIELFLHQTPSYTTFPLGEVPAVAGLHEVPVVLPEGLAPSVAEYCDYTLRAKVLRNKGLDNEGTLPIDVVGRPEDLAWPKGPRTGQDGPTDALRIEVLLDEQVVDTGSWLTGTVRLVASRDVGKDDVVLTIGATITSPRPNDKDGRRDRHGRVELAKNQALSAGQHLDLPFKVELPSGVPPTFALSETTIVWRAEARVGKAIGWTVFGVLDPKGDAGIRARKSRGLTGLMTGSPDIG